MCDFKSGDEVVCVDASGCPELCGGRTYTVSRVFLEGDTFLDHAGYTIVFEGAAGLWVYGGADFRGPSNDSAGYRLTRFRKVQRRDIGEWLKTAVGNTDKMDRSAREKVKA